MPISNQKTPSSVVCGCDVLEDMGHPLECKGIIGPAGVACSPLPVGHEVKYSRWEELGVEGRPSEDN